MQRIRSALLLTVAVAVLAGCAATDGSGGGADPWADSGSRPARSDEQTAGSASPPPPAGNDPREAVESTKPSGKVEWVAVFESPPDARYNEQRVIYVDRNSVEPHRLENLTYYLARTREVSRSGAKPKIQELAVLCEGAPVAPATALRGEGTEEGGTYALKRASAPLTSVSQFSTQRLRPDASNPNTFIVRAVCVLGTGG